MNLLGIRVQPQKANFVVVDSSGEQSEIINSELLKIPAALDFPEKLKYVRNSVLDIISEYSIEIAGIRVAEGNSKNLNITRLHIEGVIQEAFSSSSVGSYFVGRKSSIASRLNVSVKDLGNL
ncbi:MULTISPECIES: hypothetical protein [unclassified Microbulbifer]|uniref:hypothetical protein n=1 Tax=unclassified Microbulbifer TaxID=2619833 RepID=UPI0027E48560|nr:MULTISPECIES: hypothetical protein [unclassified Microbulbifer]